METYFVNTDWNDLSDFIDLNSTKFDKQSFGIKYKDGTIIVRSTTHSVIHLLKQRYELSKVPTSTKDSNEQKEWTFFGNNFLFEII